MTVPPCGDPNPHPTHEYERPPWPDGRCGGQRKDTEMSTEPTDTRHTVDDPDTIRAAILQHPVSPLRDLALELLHDLELYAQRLAVAYERLDRLTATTEETR